MSHVDLFPALATYLDGLGPDIQAIPAGRRAALGRLADFVANKRAAGALADLVFICTHNSRRSQMGQVWATVAAAVHGIEGVRAFSGGTEVTAFNPRAVAALRRAGFRIDDPDGHNPRYAVSFGLTAPSLECVSKTYADPFNPREGFAAVMTCSEADGACPSVDGADLRLALPYLDPKAADDTAQEAARYDERCRQIAAEMMDLFSRVDA